MATLRRRVPRSGDRAVHQVSNPFERRMPRGKVTKIPPLPWTVRVLPGVTPSAGGIRRGYASRLHFSSDGIQKRTAVGERPVQLLS